MKRSLVVGGRDRTWTQIDGDPNTAIIFLHGSRQSGSVARNFTDRQFEGLGPTVLYPDGVGRHFNDLRTGMQETARTENVDDVAFLTELMRPFTTVVGCGFSNGGQMWLRMLFDAPVAPAAVALFGASMPTASNTVPVGEFTPTPILAVQGTADPLVPYDGGVAGLSGMNRGETRSALDSARYLAGLNGSGRHARSVDKQLTYDDFTGGTPVRLVTIEGFGHMVPTAKELDPRLGPGTTQTTGAALLTRFLDDAAVRIR